MTILYDVAVGATVLFACAWIATCLMGRASADLRRTVWRAGFTGVALLPVVSALIATAGSPVALPGPVLAIASASAVGASASASVASGPWMAIWLTGAVMVVARLVSGLLQIRRWSRSAVEIEGVRYSSSVPVPLTWGAWQPEILMPVAARDWNASTRELVLRHERAHVRSHDWTWQLAARLITAALWFHPLAWVAERALRREAERAADDAVIADGIAAPDYAAELVRVAREAGEPVVAAVAMAAPSGLEARVRRVLDSGVCRRPASAWSVATVIAPIAALTVSLAAAPPAQEGEVVYKVGTDGVEAPRALKRVQPRYPPEALAERVQGRNVLEGIVNKDGHPSDIKVVKSAGPELDRAAIDALLQWRFEPATLDGKPVSVIVQVEFEFTVK